MKHKRGVLVAQRRMASSARAPPRVVAVVAAGAAADPAALAARLFDHSTVEVNAGATCVLARQRLTVLQPPREVHAVLDAMKVADVLLLAIPADGGLDELGERLVDAACMQGVGSVVGVLQGVGDCALRRVGLDADPNVGGGGGAAE